MADIKLKRSLLSLLLFAGFITIFYWFHGLIGQDKTELPSELIDLPAPSFEVVDLINQNILHTQKEFKGKITLLNVWASWCPSCYDEHPFWKEYSTNQDIVLVGLNYRDERAKALKFIREQGDYYQWNLFDENGRLGIDFGVYGAPETFLIDTDGKVRYRHVGIVSPEVYQNVFLPLIEKIKKGF